MKPESAIIGATMARESLPAHVKTGKVIGVHREDHTIDVAYLDGSIGRRVQTAPGWIGSTFGAVHLTAPTYDNDVLAKKTYPDAGGNVIQPPHNSSHVGRDQYVVVLQLEGHGFGTVGAVVLGNAAGQTSEMLFPKDSDTEVDGFSDLLLVRHPSDVQTTIDKGGKVSIQHPSGSRMTIGTGGVDLTKKDYDERYELRHNKDAFKDVEAVCVGAGPEVKASLQLQTGNRADLYGKQNIHIHTKTATFADLVEGGSDDGHIELFASQDILIRDGAGSRVFITGSDIHIQAPGSITVSAPAVSILGEAIVTIQGGVVQIN